MKTKNKGKNMEKEEFISKIKFIPEWVKNEKDSNKFSQHLNYRLLQKNCELRFILKKLSETLSGHFLEGILQEAEKEGSIFDEWYNSMPQEE